MRITLIKVGNGSKDYHGDFTKKEIQIIKNSVRVPTLHLFSGKSDIGNIRVDFKFGNIKDDVFNFLQFVKPSLFNTVIIDAPYNSKFADKYQKIGNTPKQFIIFADARKTTELFNHIIRIAPEVVVLKSWNYYCIKGYDIKDCFICYAGGYRKPTFLIIMRKIKGIYFPQVK